MPLEQCAMSALCCRLRHKIKPMDTMASQSSCIPARNLVPARAQPRADFVQSTLFMTVVALSGCSMQTPLPDLPNQTPATWRNRDAPTTGLQPDLQSWWRAFGDPALDALVEAALQDNLGVAVAELRLRAARRLRHRARTEFW